MAGIKSLVVHTEVDEAQRAHNCRRNAKHRIAKGERRLKVRNGRSWLHYCLSCATTILGRDIEKLKDLSRRVAPLV